MEIETSISSWFSCVFSFFFHFWSLACHLVGCLKECTRYKLFLLIVFSHSTPVFMCFYLLIVTIKPFPPFLSCSRNALLCFCLYLHSSQYTHIPSKVYTVRSKYRSPWIKSLHTLVNMNKKSKYAQLDG